MAKPVSVTQLTGYIRRILQTDPILSSVSVLGEISNLKYHSSGHVYFTLKDAGSRINCFLSASCLAAIRYTLADGMEITAEGYVSVYDKGGYYSLNIRNIEVQGAGGLAVAFEKLKEKLSKEGLFEERYKKPIPAFPKRIAVITSRTGAAVQDMLKIIRTKNSYVDVLVVPVLVQGPGAAADIADAIRMVNERYSDTDTILVGRGGGSAEELWAFNEEIVARSIFASKIPVISAVGHETDFTIADFVADMRAETPTAAANMAVPDTAALRKTMEAYRRELTASMAHYIEYRQRLLSGCRPQVLKSQMDSRLSVGMMQVQNLRRDLQNGLAGKLKLLEQELDGLQQGLEALSPKNIMARGYGAVADENGVLLGSVSGLAPGNSLTVMMQDGSADCEVRNVRGNDDGNRF